MQPSHRRNTSLDFSNKIWHLYQIVKKSRCLVGIEEVSTVITMIVIQVSGTKCQPIGNSRTRRWRPDFSDTVVTKCFLTSLASKLENYRTYFCCRNIFFFWFFISLNNFITERYRTYYRPNDIRFCAEVAAKSKNNVSSCKIIVWIVYAYRASVWSPEINNTIINMCIRGATIK